MIPLEMEIHAPGEGSHGGSLISNGFPGDQGYADMWFRLIPDIFLKGVRKTKMIWNVRILTPDINVMLLMVS
jgi:hypothetical protein